MWIIEEFQNDYLIIALSRKKVKTNPNDKIIWRTVDLYSMSSTDKALEDADIAFYLVHSMQPSTRLNQGKFEDTDLLLADNFSRAAQKNKLKQIIYLGGILPKDKHEISNHLLSRFEVEKTLGSRETPLTAIRAGIIIGPGGSSFKIVANLVKNLPVMGCPKWTKSENQPIDVFDILSLLKQCIGNPKFYDKNIEIGLSITNKNQLDDIPNCVNYLGVGPIFPTGSKNDASLPMGSNILREIINKTELPVVAIGGISLDDIDDLFKLGVSGVAVISAILNEYNPIENFYKLKENIIKGLDK